LIPARIGKLESVAQEIRMKTAAYNFIFIRNLPIIYSAMLAQILPAEEPALRATVKEIEMQCLPAGQKD
jgi:hypothetical protein